MRIRCEGLIHPSCDSAEIIGVSSSAFLLGTSFSAQIRFVQTFGDGSQTTWQALLMVVENHRDPHGERPGLDLMSNSSAADSRRPVVRFPREVQMREGRWWDGGRPHGCPIGEWHATRHRQVASAGPRRRSLTSSPHSARRYRRGLETDRGTEAETIHRGD